MERKILLPGEPGFAETMATAMQPGWQEMRAKADNQFAFGLNHQGLMIPLSDKELNEYLYGGEYDEVMEQPENEEIQEGFYTLG